MGYYTDFTAFFAVNTASEKGKELLEKVKNYAKEKGIDVTHEKSESFVMNAEINHYDDSEYHLKIVNIIDETFGAERHDDYNLHAVMLGEDWNDVEEYYDGMYGMSPINIERIVTITDSKEE